MFGIDTTKATQENGVKYDGIGRGNIHTLVVKPDEKYVTMTNLKALARRIGSGKVYVIYSKNQDRVIVNQLKVDGVDFYLHKIPYSLTSQFVMDCVNSNDVSNITRHLQEIILCKKGKVDQSAVDKIGKIAQPRSKKEVEQKFTNIAGFDFVDTTRFDIQIQKGKKDVGVSLSFSFKKVSTPSGDGVGKLSLILIDTAFDGKVLKPQEILWADNYEEADEDGTEHEIIGFVERDGFDIPLQKNTKHIAIAYIDIYGNELIQEIAV